ncbi:hypothetical protein [Pseudomonas sp.]|uniref:hypothetical protein n=1 Tax=Pseudomonas sp. TaxID=306 RepID=UPI0028A0C6DE|nr:hypothetical protein [Pseudomonas sp.]
MRINDGDLNAALEEVQRVVTHEALPDLAGNDLFPHELRAHLDDAINVDGGLYNLQLLLSSAVAVIRKVQQGDNAAGLDVSFLAEANLVRMAHVRGNLGDTEAYRQLFPEVMETYNDLDDAAIILGGLMRHVGSKFMNGEAEAEAMHQKLLHVAVRQAAQSDLVHVAGQTAQLPAAVNAQEGLGLTEILVAANSLREVIVGAGLEMGRGLRMISAGQCEFNEGVAKIKAAIRDVHPNADAAQQDIIFNTTIAYLNQFNGLVVNEVFRDIGVTWLADSSEEYLRSVKESYHQNIEHELDDHDYDADYEHELDNEIDVELTLDNEPLQLGNDSLDFRM